MSAPARRASGGLDSLRALALSCHPGPCLVVTAVAAGLAAVADNSALRTVLVAAAVLSGQLSIGWSNDLLDRARDAAVHRADKPVSAGAVSPRTVAIATTGSLLAAAVLAGVLGWWAGLITLLGVAAGWSYNLGLKATALSPLPYLVGFATLPATATLARPDHPWPPWWAVLAAGLLGVAAHFGNVLPDLDDDAATGVRGLAHRLGAPVSAAAGPAILIAASFILVLAPPGRPSRGTVIGLAALVIVAVGCAGHALARPLSRLTFIGLALLAAADVALFAASGASLT
ncbi:MAG: UbiA prenyltransferase [Frankiales bacterium]|nr:UbiA prenyltransferase [Frankiales bacterium]